MSWLDSRAGAKRDAGTSVREVVDAIEAMLDLRAEGRALFIVVDEVSQYIHQDDPRMLKLGAFVSELGQRLRGKVWLFATGQQKLEGSDALSLHLKARFPPALRVHLSPSNIRDVVHKRLLAKRKDREPLLRELFQRHRSDLKLYGYGCEEITEEDFVEVYPMLPGHIDLLMQITSNLRTRSTRVQGDAHAIRGLLQLLGDLFREERLGEGEVGDLVTLDAIFEVQHSALDPDVQTTLARVFAHPDVAGDALAQRAARAVALLELIQEQEPTTPDLVAKCLYRRLGEGNQVHAVSQALEKLRAANLVAYSEKLGFKIQSSAGQEWERERDDIPISGEAMSEVVRNKLRELLAIPELPRYKGSSFPWAALYSDGRQFSDDRVQGTNANAAVTVDFRFLRGKEDRSQETWIQRTDREPLTDRLVWVVGDPGPIESIARDFARSELMTKRYGQRRESLTQEKGRLLLEEEARLEELEKKVKGAVGEAFLDGTLFFRGKPFEPRTLGTAFATAISAAATRILPDLYPHFVDVAVSDAELAQLLEKHLTGPSPKFMEGRLGILSLDAGKYVATCVGAEPARILQFIESINGASGAALISHFGGPPYGYPVDVIRACLAGLLRAGKVRIRPDGEAEITSINDPGTRDLFRRDRDLRRADIFPAREGAITARDKVAIASFFKTHLDLDLDRENDAFADAVYQQFPGRRERLREVEALYDRLPGRPALPATLERLGKALEDCRRSRQVEEVVLALKRNLDALADGLEQLAITRSDLTEDAIRAVAAAAQARDVHLEQLRQAGEAGEVEVEAKVLAEQLAGERPWRGIAAAAPAVARVRERYVEVRRALLKRQAAEADAARGRVKPRAGFEKLSPDQAHQVLRPIADALFDTAPDAVAPSLAELQVRFPQRLDAAEEVANERLDDALARLNEAPVVKLEAGLRGREIKSRTELETVLRELEERIGPELDKGRRIRLL